MHQHSYNKRKYIDLGRRRRLLIKAILTGKINQIKLIALLNVLYTHSRIFDTSQGV
jgi:hypothetical protein